MEERISINPKMMGFYTVFKAVEFMAKPYEKILDTIPVDKWVRCKDIANRFVTVASVAKLFNALCEGGFAEKRVINDAPIEIEDERWESIPRNGEPYYIEAFDKQGRSLGEVLNPFHEKGSTGKRIKYKRTIYPKHTEYRLLP